jgi:hypothetical protein
MGTRNAPFRHADNTNCYTVNCKLGNTRNSATPAVSFNDFFADTPKVTEKKKPIKRKTLPADAKTTVKNLQEKLGKEFGVKLWLSYSESSKFVTVDTIIIPKENRQSGIGTKVMNKIIAEADKHEWNIDLTPSDSFGASKNRLEVFYRRFGFVKNQGRHRDFTTSESMIRYHS